MNVCEQLLFLIFVLGLGGCFGTSDKTKITLDLDGESTLTFLNSSDKPISISLDNWPELSRQQQKIDSLLLPNQSATLSLVVQTHHYFMVAVNEKSYRMFAQPNATIEVMIHHPDSLPVYTGDYEDINTFLLKRSRYSDFLPRAFWYQGGGTIEEMISANDSITIAQKHVVQNSQLLPSWYKSFELQRLEYVNAHSKMSSLVYRKILLGLNESFPRDFVTDLSTKTPIQNPYYYGNTAYMRFISFYLSFKADPALSHGVPKSKEEWIQSYERIVSSYQSEIEDTFLRDLLMTRFLLGVISTKRNLYRDDWKDLIQEPTYRTYIEQQSERQVALPRGASLPYFYLPDADSTYYEPGFFKGKVVLINFWATWCKPCYQEFEFENKLVEQFKNDPVVIVNIAIESEYETWTNVVKRNKLTTLNLFANEQWSEKINEYFETTALPNSVLVDKEGNIIENKCPQPSSGIDKYIKLALEQKPN